MPRSTRFVEGTFAYLPLVYVAWADSELNSDEIRFIRSNLSTAPSLSEEARNQLLEWLDPDSPPEALELVSLLGAISEMTQSASAAARDRFSLMASEFPGGSPQVMEALADIERATNLTPEVLLRDLNAPTVSSVTRQVSHDQASRLNAMLNSRWEGVRSQVFQALEHPIFSTANPDDTETYRELTLERVRVLSESGLGRLAYPREFGGEGDLDSAIGAFETLALGDLSVLVKFGVQFGLFGGSILQLGTRKHHERLLHSIGTLELPGCFAMTEREHGSNVRDLRTTATFNRESHEFVINTPGDGAAKEWIGNAARHGLLATVFARLIIDEDDLGIHAFIVPIRNDKGRTLPGIRIEDMGRKAGLNGVDNGRIWFDNVPVPQDSFLDKYAQISEAGEYTSEIRGRSARFFRMIGTLVTGRISVARAALTTSKKALKTAVIYSEERRQFGPPGESEIPILDYPTQQHRLIPRVAACYCTHFALDHLCDLARDGDTENSEKVETIAAALKAYTTQFNLETIQASRESCGGNGYSSEMGFGVMRSDTDVFATFEGDNTVLFQLVARGLLSDFKERVGDLTIRSAARFVSRRAAKAITRLNPVTTRDTREEHLRNPDFLRSALGYRTERLTHSVARRIRARLASEASPFEAFLETQDHLVQLGLAFAEELIFKESREQAAHRKEPLLDGMVALFGLDCFISGPRMVSRSGAARATEVSRCPRPQVDPVLGTSGTRPHACGRLRHT